MTARLLLVASICVALAEQPKFSAQDIDKSVQTGYGLAVADVDGDKLADVLLADARQVCWFKNPGKRGAPWLRYVIADGAALFRNVGIAAEDIDGDGKCEVAVAAKVEPEDPDSGGAVVHLVPEPDRTQKWMAARLPGVEPVIRQLQWARLDGKHWGLLIVSRFEKAERDSKLALYLKPDEPAADWKREVLLDYGNGIRGFNFRPGVENRISVRFWGSHGFGDLFRDEDGKVINLPFHYAEPGKRPFAVSALRAGKLSNHVVSRDKVTPEIACKFTATIEPFVGNQLVAIASPVGSKMTRHVLTDQLNAGTALTCGDVIGDGNDQIVVGYRGSAAKPKPVGISVWRAVGTAGDAWLENVVDDETACESLELADLDGDGKLDIVLAGRGTLRVLWNAR